MKVLIIGKGGREYSLALAMSKEDKVKKIYFAPGNGMTSSLGTNIEAKSIEELINFAKKNGIDLTVVGPEKELANGIVDEFLDNGLKIFGPDKKLSKLESSKHYMKNFLKKYNIQTAPFISTDNIATAYEYISTLKLPIVIKADGLCNGKGTVIANTYEDAKKEIKNMLSGKSFGDAGKNIIIEEFIVGEELTLSILCDNKGTYKLLPIAHDYKKIFDNDRGKNSGGMGCYAPVLIEKYILNKIEDNIIKPILRGIKNEYKNYSGLLYIGVIIQDEKPYVLECNVRFGDPECQTILPLISTPIFDLLYASATNNLSNINLEINEKFSVTVVLADKNYPDNDYTVENIMIEKIPKNIKSNIIYANVIHKNKSIYTNGGRVINSVGIGDTIRIATEEAYKLINYIHFNGMLYRKDIAKRI